MKYKFIIGWMDGSDGAGSDKGYNSQDELIAAAQSGDPNLPNISIFAIEADNEDDAIVRGQSAAFMENWTAHDSLSVIIAEE